MNKLYFHTEPFTKEEKSILSQYFTNVDKPVFGLINMPDIVKGALFARYSRSAKSLRRLFLDEFYASDSVSETTIDNNLNMKRATTLYDKMILDFGDDSVAQLGGAHLACEQVSNILAKFIEKGRIASYLEQSTRYVYYNEKKDGHYKYMIPPEVENSVLKSEYTAFMDELFDTYSDMQQELIPIFKQKYPRADDMPSAAWESTIKAKVCDTIRGLLPASTKTNLGIFANGQYFEYLLIRMYASDNEEIKEYADMILEELRKIIPSFLSRVDLENRGKAWSKYLNDINSEMEEKVATIKLSHESDPTDNTVDLTGWDSDATNKITKAILYEYSSYSDQQLNEYVRQIPDGEKENIIKAYAGQRINRRHKPGRAFESVVYDFDILSDYGAFRDLQRHRMLTIMWQRLSTRNGYFIPEILDEYPTLKQKYTEILNKAQLVYERFADKSNTETAQYIVPFAYRLRYSISMNLREAFHLIELRTQKQGHDSYRKVCMQMHDLMINKAGHKLLGELMNFVDHNLYDLSRADAEKNKELKKLKK